MSTDLTNKQKRNILAVDDVPENLRLLSSMLTEQGYKVRKAISSRAALTSVKTEVPDLILLDVGMPEMDGYEVCTQLKACEETRDIPVIFISALNEVMDKVKAFGVGGADYITKPFKVEELIARVENQLAIARQRLSLQERTLVQLQHL